MEECEIVPVSFILFFSLRAGGFFRRPGSSCRATATLAAKNLGRAWPGVSLTVSLTNDSDQPDTDSAPTVGPEMVSCPLRRCLFESDRAP